MEEIIIKSSSSVIERNQNSLLPWIGTSYDTTAGLFRKWNKLHFNHFKTVYTKIIFIYVQNNSFSYNLASIPSSTLILTACSPLKIVTWRIVVTTIYVKICHCRQNISSETWNCLYSEQPLTTHQLCVALLGCGKQILVNILTLKVYLEDH